MLKFLKYFLIYYNILTRGIAAFSPAFFPEPKPSTRSQLLPCSIKAPTQKERQLRPKSFQSPFKVLLTILSQSVQKGHKPLPKSLSQCYCAENQLHLVNFHLSNLNWTDPKAGAKPALPLLLVIGTSHSAFKQFLKFQLQPNFSTRNGEKTLLLILLSIVGKSDFSSKVLILIYFQK